MARPMTKKEKKAATDRAIVRCKAALRKRCAAYDANYYAAIRGLRSCRLARAEVIFAVNDVDLDIAWEEAKCAAMAEMRR